MGRSHKSKRFGVTAHLRLVMFVSLRTAASAEAPLAPMLLPSSLRAKDGMGMMGEEACQWALTRVFWGGGALDVCDHRLLEDGSERSDALGANAIEPETARDGRGQ